MEHGANLKIRVHADSVSRLQTADGVPKLQRQWFSAKQQSTPVLSAPAASSPVPASPLVHDKAKTSTDHKQNTSTLELFGAEEAGSNTCFEQKDDFSGQKDNHSNCF